jgi:hypothetical protein
MSLAGAQGIPEFKIVLGRRKDGRVGGRVGWSNWGFGVGLGGLC